MFVFLRRSTTAMGRARGGRLLLVLAALFLALLLLSGCAAEGEGEEGSPVAAAEEAALYAAIGGFVGKAWNGSGLFPDPCGQTAIQELINPQFSSCSTFSCFGIQYKSLLTRIACTSN